MMNYITIILVAFSCMLAAESKIVYMSQGQAPPAPPAPPKPCCVPAQWTGKIGENVGYNSPRHPGAIFGYMNATYDFTNKRMALDEMLFLDGRRPMSQNVIIIGKKMYLIYGKSQKCFVKTLKSGMREACIPQKARFTAEMTFGLGANSLKGDGWMFFIKNRRMEGSVSITVTKECVPIGQVSAGKVGRRGNFGFLSNMGFFDIQGGVKDPKVFDLPKSCEKAEEFDEENPQEELEYLQLTASTFSYLYE